MRNLRTKSCWQNIGITPPKQKNLEEIFTGGPSGPAVLHYKIRDNYEQPQVKGQVKKSGTH